MYATEDDPYCYPGTGILKNKFGIRDQEQLSALETELAMVRADEPLPEGRLNVPHFLAVHHHLFQDLYDWAGVPRTVRTWKGNSHFCYPEHIEAQLAQAFSKLASNNYFTAMSKQAFSDNAAEFLATLNVIHAFREGNGRAQLSYMVLLAREAGYELDVSRIDPGVFLDAMILSFHGNEVPLSCILFEIAL